MIESITIQNIALIERLSVNFGAGLNILSGETGAGKSVIIDAVGFALGERAGREIIRAGADEAYAELFVTVSSVTANRCREAGADVDTDNALILARSLNAAGKSICRINGRAATIGMMREIGGLLVDIHGQHEHQSLLNPDKHLELLDRFCEDGIKPLLALLAKEHAGRREARKRLNAINMDEATRIQRMDMLDFQIAELTEAKLTSGEDERLNERKRVIAGAAKIAEKAARAGGLLSDENGSAVDKLYTATALMRDLAAAEPALYQIAEAVESAYATLEDAAEEFRKYRESLDYDEDEIDNIEARLDELYKLKRKYGANSSEMLTFLNRAKAERDELGSAGESAAEIEKTLAEATKAVNALCADISAMRRIAADKLREEIERGVRDLGMANATFAVSIERLSEPTANGADAVEFLISANKGEPVKPLSRIASGGELSRVMLALKASLADFDDIETFIFDEIDAGVSGKTAVRVAAKLRLVAKDRQVLCITHLPQILAAGDSNYQIEKTEESGRAATSIIPLNEDGAVGEIARLIGGHAATEAAFAAARELRGAALSAQ